MTELFSNWKWDIYHIGATFFLIAIALMIRWIFLDSKRINKKSNEKRRKESRSLMA
jgi:hypothetical protein